MKEQYAVPFVPNVRTNQPAVDSAAQLTALIKQWRTEGWEFSHLENITTVVNRGCIAALFGPSTEVVLVQVAILVRPTPTAVAAPTAQ